MIIFYFLIIFVIGIYKCKYINDNDYLYASRSLTLTPFIATIVTTWYGGILEIGRFSYQYGIVTWFNFGLFYYIAAIVFGLYIGPKLHENNISSISQYFKKYLVRNFTNNSKFLFSPTIPNTLSNIKYNTYIV